MEAELQTTSSERRKAASCEILSQMMDGELDADAAMLACRAWCDDAAARDAWRTYHLVGDALRSDDLCSDGHRDAAFLGKLKARLEAEPIIVAPVPIAASRRRTSRLWSTSVAALAGVVVVGGVVVMTTTSAPLDKPERLVSKAAPQAAAVPSLAALTSSPPQAAPKLAEPAVVDNGPLLRDARLDRYLAAHREFGGSTALGVPAEFVRDVVVVTPSR